MNASTSMPTTAPAVQTTASPVTFVNGTSTSVGYPNSSNGDSWWEPLWPTDVTTGHVVCTGSALFNAEMDACCRQLDGAIWYYFEVKGGKEQVMCLLPSPDDRSKRLPVYSDCVKGKNLTKSLRPSNLFGITCTTVKGREQPSSKSGVGRVRRCGAGSLLLLASFAAVVLAM